MSGADELGVVYDRTGRLVRPTRRLADGNGDTCGGYLTRRAAHELSPGAIVMTDGLAFSKVAEIADGTVSIDGARRPAVRIRLGAVGEPRGEVLVLASTMVLIRVPGSRS